jgi:hypothetical protein
MLVYRTSTQRVLGSVPPTAPNVLGSGWEKICQCNHNQSLEDGSKAISFNIAYTTYIVFPFGHCNFLTMFAGNVKQTLNGRQTVEGKLLHLVSGK